MVEYQTELLKSGFFPANQNKTQTNGLEKETCFNSIS